MGYHTNPNMVEENKDILTAILHAITNEGSVSFDVPRDINISTEQWRLRRILAAADYHTSACGGLFAGLGQLSTIRIDLQTHQLTVVPRTTGRKSPKLSITEVIDTELDVIANLQEPNQAGNIIILDFEPTPAYDTEEFEAALLAIGWELHRSTLTLDPEKGRLSVAVERIEISTAHGFDALGLESHKRSEG